MVSRIDAALPEARASAPSRERSAAKRWSLFLSIFGALGASLALWAVIIWGVAAAAAWLDRLF
jgi:pheromone shutdown protein TraB